jgi:alanine dehydrogenase
MKTIGIIREGKKPSDLRTPLTPRQCVELMNIIPDIKILVQSSPFRCFNDDEYKNAGIEVVEDMTSCDILLGVKEVPVSELIDDKTYLFFSHTIKKQAHNRALLRSILEKNIRLIDYETLVWDAGNRIIGFGRFAGIVGTHYAFSMMGQKYGLFNFKPAHLCHDYSEMIEQYIGVKLPSVKIVLCGDGRVAHGCIELMKKLKIHRVSQEEFLDNTYDEPVYVHLRSEDYYAHKDVREWDKSDFYKHPEDYVSSFKPYFQKADVMLNAIFWKEDIPLFFTHEDMKRMDFNIKIISDITCDVPGPIPSTTRSTTINDPYYGYNPFTAQETKPFQANTIDVQAVGNLPCELPIDASIEFGEQLIRHVLPSLLIEDKEGIIKNATIAERGKLNERFAYLQDYVQ